MHPLLLTFGELRRRRPAVGYRDDEHVEQILQEQLSMQSTIASTSGDNFLPTDDAAAVVQNVDNIIALWTALANSADRRSVLNWSVVPKCHLLWHFAHRCQWLHPRRGNTMIDEDYVGLLKHIVHSCAFGTDQNMVPTAVVDKVRWGEHFRAVYGNAYHH